MLLSCCGVLLGAALCCTQSLSARKVVGVEMVKQAIEDAEENAKLNGILTNSLSTPRASGSPPSLPLHPSL